MKNRIFVIVLMAAGFLGSLSQNLLTSALPSIISFFGIDTASGQWLTTVYILVLGIITAISAFIFYRFHTRALIQTSLCIFLAGCILAYFSPNFPILLLARIIQACGAGVLIPLLQIVVLYIYPPEKQGQALGLTGIIVGFAPAVGPTLSGLMVDSFGWRSIFLLLLALSAVVLIIGRFVLREVGERQTNPMDYLSVILYSIGFTTFMLAVTEMKKSGFFQVKVLVLFAAGIFCLSLFIHRQSGRKNPLLKISLFRFQPLLVGTVLLGISYIMMMAGTILVPLYIQTVCGYSATLSGLSLLPGSLLIAVLSPFVGRLIDRHGTKKLSILGMIFLTVGNFCFLPFQADTSIAAITCAYAIRCAGLAILITTCTTLGVQYLPLKDKPHGSAILNSLRQMMGSLFSTVLVITASAVSAPDDMNMNGICAAFRIMAFLSTAGILLAVFAIRPPKGNGYPQS